MTLSFCDNVGHIFQQQAYNTDIIGYESQMNPYVFWIDDEYTNYLSVNNYYVLPIRLVLPIPTLDGVSCDIDLIEVTIESKSDIFRLVSSKAMNNVKESFDITKEIYTILTTKHENGKGLIGGIVCDDYVMIPFYVIANASEEGTWRTNLKIQVTTPHLSQNVQESIYDNYEAANIYCPITVGGVFKDLSEELIINGQNMGIKLPYDILKSVYQCSYNNDKLDTALYNEKMKEYLINKTIIKDECGNYKSARSALEWFGWGDKISVYQLIKTDNEITNQYLRCNFNISSDILDLFVGYRNTSLLSIVVKYYEESECKEFDFNSFLYGENHPVIDYKDNNLFNKTIDVIYKRWIDDNEGVSYTRNYFDYTFNELGLKLACLGINYERYFLPIHMNVQAASLEWKTYSNDIKVVTYYNKQHISEEPLFVGDTNVCVEFPKNNRYSVNKKRLYTDNQYNIFTHKDNNYVIDDFCCEIPIHIHNSKSEYQFNNNDKDKLQYGTFTDTHRFTDDDWKAIHHGTLNFLSYRRVDDCYKIKYNDSEGNINTTIMKYGYYTELFPFTDYDWESMRNGTYKYFTYHSLDDAYEFIYKTSYTLTYGTSSNEHEFTADEWIEIKNGTYAKRGLSYYFVGNNKYLFVHDDKYILKVGDSRYGESEWEQIKNGIFSKEGLSYSHIEDCYEFCCNDSEGNDITYIMKYGESDKEHSYTAAEWHTIKTGTYKYYEYEPVTTDCYYFKYDDRTGNIDECILEEGDAKYSKEKWDAIKNGTYTECLPYELTKNYYYDTHIFLSRNGHEIQHTHFQFFESDGFHSFVIYPRYAKLPNTDIGRTNNNENVDNIFDALYWIDLDYTIDILINDMWFKYDFRIVLSDFIVDIGYLEYIEGQNFQLINEISDNDVEFNVPIMADSELVAVSNKNFYDDIMSFKNSQQMDEYASNYWEQVYIQDNDNYLNLVYYFDIITDDNGSQDNLIYNKEQEAHVYNTFFDSEKNFKGIKENYVNNVENVSTYFDFYLMHDNSKYWGVLISKAPVSRTLEVNFKPSSQAVYTLNNDGNTVYKFVNIKSYKRFLINRMKYVSCGNVKKIGRDKIIVAKVIGEDNAEEMMFNMNITNKWKFQNVDVNPQNIVSSTSNTNIGIMSIPQGSVYHKTGYYDIEVRYNIDDYVDHHQTKKCRFLITDENDKTIHL